jgi:hypothetical protein
MTPPTIHPQMTQMNADGGGSSSAFCPRSVERDAGENPALSF